MHERLRSYTYIYARPGDKVNVYQDPELAAQRAAEYVAQGFTALKFDPAGPYSAFDGRQLSLAALDLCERFMRELRAAVGSSADLLFGTHGQMTAAGAIRLARRLEPYDPLWFEEPVPPDAPEEMARVARATSIPIAAGERLATKYDFARVLRAGAAAILQMNLGRVGGLLEAKKIAALAEVQHVQLAPHLYCGPVVGAANIQLATCSPNFLILEGIERWQGFHARPAGEADPLGGRVRHPANRTRARRGAERGGHGASSLSGHAAAPGVRRLADRLTRAPTLQSCNAARMRSSYQAWNMFTMYSLAPIGPGR